MSAGSNGGARPQNDLGLLAPKFRAAVEAALKRCADRGYDASVFETYRSDELQKIYYARGRTVIPPTRTVTNAPDNLRSWHGYGLAVDVISRQHHWSPPKGDAWFREVAAIFKEDGLIKWGGDWTKPDMPHFQWGQCKPSPSTTAQALIKSDGMEAVWKAVGAAD